VPRRPQEHDRKPDLAAHYCQIGIRAVAASARYQGRRQAVNADRASPTGAERQIRAQARVGAGENRRTRRQGQ